MEDVEAGFGIFKAKTSVFFFSAVVLNWRQDILRQTKSERSVIGVVLIEITQVKVKTITLSKV